MYSLKIRLDRAGKRCEFLGVSPLEKEHVGEPSSASVGRRHATKPNTATTAPDIDIDDAPENGLYGF